MASYSYNTLSSSKEDTELYAANINITGVTFYNKFNTVVCFEFLVIYKDASRWVRDSILVEGTWTPFEAQFRKALTEYVSAQRETLKHRSAKLSVGE